MYNYILNPDKDRFIKINSKEGNIIIKKYIKSSKQFGGTYINQEAGAVALAPVAPAIINFAGDLGKNALSKINPLTLIEKINKIKTAFYNAYGFYGHIGDCNCYKIPRSKATKFTRLLDLDNEGNPAGNILINPITLEIYLCINNISYDKNTNHTFNLSNLQKIAEIGRKTDKSMNKDILEKSSLQKICLSIIKMTHNGKKKTIQDIENSDNFNTDKVTIPQTWNMWHKESYKRNLDSDIFRFQKNILLFAVNNYNIYQKNTEIINLDECIKKTPSAKHRVFWYNTIILDDTIMSYFDKIRESENVRLKIDIPKYLPDTNSNSASRGWIRNDTKVANWQWQGGETYRRVIKSYKIHILMPNLLTKYLIIYFFLKLEKLIVNNKNMGLNTRANKVFNQFINDNNQSHNVDESTMEKSRSINTDLLYELQLFLNGDSDLVNLEEEYREVIIKKLTDSENEFDRRPKNIKLFFYNNILNMKIKRTLNQQRLDTYAFLRNNWKPSINCYKDPNYSLNAKNLIRSYAIWKIKENKIIKKQRLNLENEEANAINSDYNTTGMKYASESFNFKQVKKILDKNSDKIYITFKYNNSGPNIPIFTTASEIAKHNLMFFSIYLLQSGVNSIWSTDIPYNFTLGLFTFIMFLKELQKLLENTLLKLQSSKTNSPSPSHIGELSPPPVPVAAARRTSSGRVSKRTIAQAAAAFAAAAKTDDVTTLGVSGAVALPSADAAAGVAAPAPRIGELSGPGRKVLVNECIKYKEMLLNLLPYVSGFRNKSKSPIFKISAVLAKTKRNIINKLTLIFMKLAKNNLNVRNLYIPSGNNALSEVQEFWDYITYYIDECNAFNSYNGELLSQLIMGNN